MHKGIYPWNSGGMHSTQQHILLIDFQPLFWTIKSHLSFHFIKFPIILTLDCLVVFAILVLGHIMTINIIIEQADAYFWDTAHCINGINVYIHLEEYTIVTMSHLLSLAFLFNLELISHQYPIIVFNLYPILLKLIPLLRL